MTFTVMQQELADRLGLDYTVSANATRLKRWLNIIQQDMASRWDFSWLRDRCIVQTVVEKTAGTVAIVDGSATVTGTSTAFASTDKRSFIQFEGETNWYEVTFVASQVLTISPAYEGTSNALSTYTLRKVFYDLPSDLFQVFDVRQSNMPAKLECLGEWTLDLNQPDITTVSEPTGYYISRLNPDTAATSAKVYQIGFFPIPDAIYNIEIRYEKIATDLSADADIALIPVPYHNVMVDGAEWLGRKFVNSPKEGECKQAYEYAIKQMVERDNENNDYFPVLQASDAQPTSRFQPFPSTFEQPQ